MDSTERPNPVILFSYTKQDNDLSHMKKTALAPFPARPTNGLIGHRGLPHEAPENSLLGFKLAADAKLSMVEFDVQVTQDDHLIIMHDDTIDRTTTGKGLVYKLTLDQLRVYQLKNLHDAQSNKLPIPTLIETMDLLHARQVQANIELKLPENLAEIELAPIRTKLLTSFESYLGKHWPNNIPWPLVSSFDHPILIQLRKNYPEIPIGFLTEEPTENDLSLAIQYAPASVNAKFSVLTEDFLRLATKKNVPILAYTVNNAEKAQELLDSGVYALFTDLGNNLKTTLKNSPSTTKQIP